MTEAAVLADGARQANQIPDTFGGTEQDMKPSTILVLLAIVLSVAGCGDRKTAPDPSQSPKGSPASSQLTVIPTTEPPNHPGIRESLRKYELSVAAIIEHHERLTMTKLPDYVEDPRGWGGEGASGSSYGQWGFIVPQEHITDFKNYILALGVPEKWMHETSPYRTAEREKNWAPPAPPIDTPVFVRSVIGRGDYRALGMFSPKGQSMIYHLDNPNLRNSMIRLTFVEKTGHVMVIEKFINYD